MLTHPLPTWSCTMKQQWQICWRCALAVVWLQVLLQAPGNLLLVQQGWLEVWPTPPAAGTHLGGVYQAAIPGLNTKSRASAQLDLKMSTMCVGRRLCCITSMRVGHICGMSSNYAASQAVAPARLPPSSPCFPAVLVSAHTTWCTHVHVVLLLSKLTTGCAVPQACV